MLPVKYNRLEIMDMAGRVAMVLYFGFSSIVTSIALSGLLKQFFETPSLHIFLDAMAKAAVLLFLIMVVSLTVLRHKPISSAEGWEPRASALGGTFAMLLLPMMPGPAFTSPALTVCALVVMMSGAALSAYVISFLGRSFSIMAEARELVRSGPYQYVRHPLYLAELIMIVGVVMLNLSVGAVVLAVAQWLLQLRRMHNEEKVLTAAFPSYEEYRKDVPRVLPRLGFLRTAH
jgi:protein-S-isoprenylcysteine O-methyltransferase Ste14